MTKKLKELRNTLLQSELKDVKFRHKNKENVFNQLHAHSKKRYNWLPMALSFIVVFTFIFTGFLFLKDYMTQPSLQSESHANKQNEEIAMEKEDVRSLMLNAANHFNSAKGIFVFKDEFLSETLEYEVSSNEGAYIKTKIDKQDINNALEKKVLDKTEIFNGNQLLTLYEESKKYELSDLLNEEHPFVGTAEKSLYPNDIAEIFLKDEKRWVVGNHTTTFLDRKAIQIKGEFDEENSIKFAASTFRLWVDKETGILLKMELTNKKGRVIESLETKKIELNQSVDKNKFSIVIPDDYTQADSNSVD